MGWLRHQPSEAGFSCFTIKTLSIKAGGGVTPALRFHRTLPFCCSGIGGSTWRRRNRRCWLIPGSVLKKRKREEQWGIARQQELAAKKKKSRETRKIIFARAQKCAKEYETQENELVQSKREARTKGGFYVSPEPDLLFIIRIPIFNGVFLKVNKTSMNMLRRVEPHVTYGYPNLESAKELIYKRGYGNPNKQRIPLAGNSIINHRGNVALSALKILFMRS